MFKKKIKIIILLFAIKINTIYGKKLFKSSFENKNFKNIYKSTLKLEKKNNNKNILEYNSYEKKNNNKNILEYNSYEKKNNNKNILEYNSDNEDYDISKKKTYLIGNSSLKYNDIYISAEYIEINWKTNIVYARGKLNNISKKIESFVTFIQGEKKYEYDSLSINLDTKKIDAKNIRIEEKEGVIISEKLSQINNDVSLMNNVIYTTDTYFKNKKTQDPDFFIKTSKIKYYYKKFIVTGPIFIYFYKVPFPIPLPFSYISVLKNSSSGFIFPHYGRKNNKNYFIENLGFLWNISDYLRTKILISLYSNKSWIINSITNYKKRYKYFGNFQFTYNTKIDNKSKLNDNKKTNNYKLHWSHIQNKNLNPNFNFSSNVNFLNSDFYKNNLSINNIINKEIYRNTINSNISIYKIFSNNTKFNLKIFDLIQNLKTKKIIGDFLSSTLEIDRKNIFSRKKNKLLKNIYIDHNFSFNNRVEIQENFFLKKKMFDNIENNFDYKLKLGNNLKILKCINFSSNINYNEILNFKKKEINEINETTTKKKLRGLHYLYFENELSTIIHSFFQFRSNNSFKTLRHKINAKIKFKYSPNFTKFFWGFHENFENKKNNYNNSFYTDPFKKTSNQEIDKYISTKKIEFSLNNNLEMKIKNKYQNEKINKIIIFDILNFNINYDINKKTFKWSNIEFIGDTSFLKNISTKFRGDINIYKIKKDIKDSFEEVKINEIGSFNIENFNLYFIYNINNKISKRDSFKKRNIYNKKGEIRYEKFFFDKDNYAHYYLPWSLNTGINYCYDKNYIKNSNYRTEFQFYGELSLTPYWEINFDSYYDLKNKKITRLDLKFKRDIRSFIMNFDWIPISYDYKTVWNFFIGIKANIFKSVRYSVEKNINI